MRRILILSAFVLFPASIWMALTVGQVSPVVRNIIYIHVPSAICALACFVLLLVASIAYLATGKTVWDHIGAASVEAGLVLTTILNLTGSLFSRAEWNTWWTASPRLVSSAILWFLCVVYLILRAGIPGPERRARICAVFGIIAFLDVPMIFITARFITDIHKPDFSFESHWQTAAFALAILANLVLGAVLISIKRDILASKANLESEMLH